MLAGARVEVDDRKEDPLDFALWTSLKTGEPNHHGAVRPPVKSRYVLEVHEGLAGKEGLVPGSQLLLITSGLTPF